MNRANKVRPYNPIFFVDNEMRKSTNSLNTVRSSHNLNSQRSIVNYDDKYSPRIMKTDQSENYKP